MTKHHLADLRDTRPHRPKSARHNRLSSPASGASVSSSGLSTTSRDDDRQTAAERKAAEVMARYNEVNLLFNSHFPGIDVSGAQHHAAHSTASPQSLTRASGSGAAGGHAFGYGADDDYDADRELALELNEAMGLVRRLPPRPPAAGLPGVAGAGAKSTTFPWLADGGLPIDPAMGVAALETTTVPMMPIAATATSDFYAAESGTEGDDDIHSTHSGAGGNNFFPTSSRSPPLPGYPFTSPTSGQLMVTASPPDAASYTTRSPPPGSRLGDAVEDLGWLGDSLQRNARIQLQELSEGSVGSLPYVS